MILRFLTLMALVASLAFPALAEPADAKRCPTQTSFEMCHSPQYQGLASSQGSFEKPCGAKALHCPAGVLPDGLQREGVLFFGEPHMVWTSQTFGPPDKPPRA